MAFRQFRFPQFERKSSVNQTGLLRAILTWVKNNKAGVPKRDDNNLLPPKLELSQARHTIAGVYITIFLGIISAILAYLSVNLTKKYGENKDLLYKQDTLIRLLIHQDTLQQHQLNSMGEIISELRSENKGILNLLTATKNQTDYFRKGAIPDVGYTSFMIDSLLESKNLYLFSVDIHNAGGRTAIDFSATIYLFDQTVFPGRKVDAYSTRNVNEEYRSIKPNGNKEIKFKCEGETTLAKFKDTYSVLVFRYSDSLTKNIIRDTFFIRNRIRNQIDYQPIQIDESITLRKFFIDKKW